MGLVKNFGAFDHDLPLKNLKNSPYGRGIGIGTGGTGRGGGGGGGPLRLAFTSVHFQHKIGLIPPCKPSIQNLGLNVAKIGILLVREGRENLSRLDERVYRVAAN